ncbi:hypothetical protein B0A49_06284 [Cryomyces minteri]|uniref:Apple domain-containing protein n=1 Tax=Cryomyces minteri TaxID=331657 RepID=A0A4U0WWY0_9PEZI|nr:hypothetical protein B0A49_06284 [Cryomyces minteri]
MQFVVSLAALALAVVPIIASPVATVVASNGVLSGAPPQATQPVKARDNLVERAVCTNDAICRVLKARHVSAKASSFCSAYLQTTTTVTATSTVSQTVVATALSTVIIPTTATATTTVSTTTLTCAAAPTTTATTCGFAAYGFSVYLISQSQNTDPVTCHLNCLADPTCKSFQIQAGGAMYNNLYKAVTAGNTQAAPGDVFTFYDRGCSDYLPAGCTAAPAVQAATKAKRAAAKTSCTVPPALSPLATVVASRISSGCSCLITPPVAKTFVATTVPVTSLTTITTTIPTTVVSATTVFVSVTATATVSVQ